MQTYLYLSLIPESLIASMLPPLEFGAYYATGTQKRTRGRAIFFEIDPGLKSDYFPMEAVEQRCVPHEDGRPRKSTYLSIYRVLEHLPLEAIGKLYLTTDDGRSLALEPKAYERKDEFGLHLYQELAPVRPRVISTDGPREFCQFITNSANPVHVPTITFAELVLGGLSGDPENAKADDLPYRNIAHLRDCLMSLKQEPQKRVKTVVRSWAEEMLFRTIKNGIFLGSQEGLKFYEMPSIDQLEREYYDWWRSAQASFA